MINTKDLRFVEIPRMNVASIQCISTSPENDSLKEIADFMEYIKRNSKILELRHFGYVPKFNKGGNGDIDVFERLITVPMGIEVPKPFMKKHFPEGLYAAHTVPIGFFDRISALKNIVSSIPGYKLVEDEEFDVIEEYLTPWNFAINNIEKFFTDTQIDLLVKVKRCNL